MWGRNPWWGIISRDNPQVAILVGRDPWWTVMWQTTSRWVSFWGFRFFGNPLIGNMSHFHGGTRGDRLPLKLHNETDPRDKLKGCFRMSLKASSSSTYHTKILLHLWSNWTYNVGQEKRRVTNRDSDEAPQVIGAKWWTAIRLNVTSPWSTLIFLTQRHPIHHHQEMLQYKLIGILIASTTTTPLSCNQTSNLTSLNLCKCHKHNGIFDKCYSQSELLSHNALVLNSLSRTIQSNVNGAQ